MWISYRLSFWGEQKVSFSGSAVPWTLILLPVARVGPWSSSPWILAVPYLRVWFLPCHFAFLSPFVRGSGCPAAHKLNILDSSPSLQPFTGQPHLPACLGAFPPSDVGCVGHQEQLRLRRSVTGLAKPLKAAGNNIINET